MYYILDQWKTTQQNDKKFTILTKTEILIKTSDW